MSHNSSPAPGNLQPSLADRTFEASRQFFEAMQVPPPHAEVRQWADGANTFWTDQPGATFSQHGSIGNLIVTVDDGTQQGAKYWVGSVHATPDEWEAKATGKDETKNASLVVELPPQDAQTQKFVETRNGKKPYWSVTWTEDGEGRMTVVVGGEFQLPGHPPRRVRSVSSDLGDFATLSYDYPPARAMLRTNNPDRRLNLANPFDSAEEIASGAVGRVRSKLLGLDKINYPVR